MIFDRNNRNMKTESAKNYFKLLIFFAFLSFSNTSCVDKCKGEKCSDHGYCFKGDCFCSNGYSGENCDIRMSDKFVGNYKGQLIDGNDEQNIDVKINNKNNIDPWNIELKLDIKNSVEYNLLAHVNLDTLYIHEQRITHIDSFIDNGEVVYDISVNDIHRSKGLISKDRETLNFILSLVNPVIKIPIRYQVKVKRE